MNLPNVDYKSSMNFRYRFNMELVNNKNQSWMEKNHNYMQLQRFGDSNWKFLIALIFIVLQLAFVNSANAQLAGLYDTDGQELKFHWADSDAFTPGGYISGGTNNRTQGAVHLYRNVLTNLTNDLTGETGQNVDAIVRISTVSGKTIDEFDPATSAYIGPTPPGANQADWFVMPLSGSGSGLTTFDVQFIRGGSFNVGTLTGQPVRLFNVVVNSFDIDGTGQAGSYQYVEFGGFSSLELASNSYLDVQYQEVSGLTRFKSTVTTNNAEAPGTANGDRYRVRVVYDEISNFQISMGSDSGVAHFANQFAQGPTWVAPTVTTTAPLLDLNGIVGTDPENPASNSHSAAYTGFNPVNFSTVNGTPLYASTPNVRGVKEGGTEIADPDFNNLVVRFTPAQLADGVDERIRLNGDSPTYIYPTTIGVGTTSNVATIDGINYNVFVAIDGSKKSLTFTQAGAGPPRITKAQMQSLIEAFQYENIADERTGGDRVFELVIRDGV